MAALFCGHTDPSREWDGGTWRFISTIAVVLQHSAAGQCRHDADDWAADRGARQNGIIGSAPDLVGRAGQCGRPQPGPSPAMSAAGRFLPMRSRSLTRGWRRDYGGTLTVSGGSWSNSGVWNVASNSTLNVSGSGTNSGTLNVTNGTAVLGRELDHGGVGVVNQQGGSINLTGALNNTAAVWC